ncbi:MAG: hypothetical protein Q7J54_07250 [Candidatus Woesearchaeota archaeon]|nr:hypothetical protein [Candidatus Woesearchaeota archaeon]
MTQERKSLQEIVIDALGFGVIFYPIYSGITAIGGPETFVDKIKDKNTLYITLGAMTGKVLYEVGEKVYQSIRNR